MICQSCLNNKSKNENRVDCRVFVASADNGKSSANVEVTECSSYKCIEFKYDPKPNNKKWWKVAFKFPGKKEEIVAQFLAGGDAYNYGLNFTKPQSWGLHVQTPEYVKVYK